MSEAIDSLDSYLSVGDAASPNLYTEIAEVIEMNGPDQSAEEIDVTHLRSTSGYREFLPSFKQGGTLNCVANYIPGNATHASGADGLRGLFTSRDIRGWKRTFSDGTEEFFDGYVSAFSTPLAVGVQSKLNFSVRVTGPVTADEA
jgi:hypothetical protein